jgi:hypothetical protein
MVPLTQGPKLKKEEQRMSRIERRKGTEQWAIRKASLVMTLSLLSAVSAAAGVIGPEKASQVVTLTNGNGSDPCPNGASNWNAVRFSPVAGTFSIPAGQVLIVTELVLTVLHTEESSKNDLVAWLLSGPTNINVVARQSMALDSGGLGGSTLTFPQGIPFKAGEVLCVENPRIAGDFTEAFAYGYLTRDN